MMTGTILLLAALLLGASGVDLASPARPDSCLAGTACGATRQTTSSATPAQDENAPGAQDDLSNLVQVREVDADSFCRKARCEPGTGVQLFNLAEAEDNVQLTACGQPGPPAEADFVVSNKATTIVGRLPASTKPINATAQAGASNGQSFHREFVQGSATIRVDARPSSRNRTTPSASAVAVGPQAALSEPILVEWSNNAPLVGERFRLTLQDGGILGIGVSAQLALAPQGNIVRVDIFDQNLTGFIVTVTATFIGVPIWLALVNFESAWYFPFVPLASEVYGICHEECQFSATTDLNESAPITIECSSGTRVTSQIGTGVSDVSTYVGGKDASFCKFSVPQDFFVSGISLRGPSATGTFPLNGRMLTPSSGFQKVTPVPVDLEYVELISDSPAKCSLGFRRFRLVGCEGCAVFGFRLPSVAAGSVIYCNEGVAAFGSDKVTGTYVQLSAGCSDLSEPKP